MWNELKYAAWWIFLNQQCTMYDCITQCSISDQFNNLHIQQLNRRLECKIKNDVHYSH
jgi:hypothetical protein